MAAPSRRAKRPGHGNDVKIRYSASFLGTKISYIVGVTIETRRETAIAAFIYVPD